MKKIILLLSTALFCTAGLFGQKIPITATVDVQRVLSEYNEYQAAFETIKSSVAPVEEEIKRMRESAQEVLTKGRQLQEEMENPSIDAERKAEAEAEIREIEKQLQTMQIEMQQFNQQAQQLYKKGQEEDLMPLRQKAVEAVKQVANDKGIDMVIPSDVAIFYLPELEITDSVIALLNASE